MGAWMSLDSWTMASSCQQAPSRAGRPDLHAEPAVAAVNTLADLVDDGVAGLIGSPTEVAS